ncbi:hypothetical protein [Variovorax sp. Sphag1AA]|uniref:hypothetical protein n=1 Tax=Variovorax sp. Sphag1AA TaxID=2587027 RepID=UPI001615E454|nr:hypothetical protein [Variovorax sp. Sphag1AA]MBB3176808.1 hypothetical protein [Variovorax sp. Sphag1AA]
MLRSAMDARVWPKERVAEALELVIECVGQQAETAELEVALVEPCVNPGLLGGVQRSVAGRRIRTDAHALQDVDPVGQQRALAWEHVALVGVLHDRSERVHGQLVDEALDDLPAPHQPSPGQCRSQALLMCTRATQAGIDAKYAHDQSIEFVVAPFGAGLVKESAQDLHVRLSVGKRRSCGYDLRLEHEGHVAHIHLECRLVGIAQ